MQSDAAKTASRYVDDEVVQRLLKAMDFLVFFATASFYSTAFAGPSDIPNGAAIITFFSLALAFLCVLLLRDLELYKAPALLNGGWAFMKSAATAFITGVAAYSLFDYFLIPLAPQWPLYWSLIVTSHLALSRFFAQAWARPVASAGKIPQAHRHCWWR